LREHFGHPEIGKEKWSDTHHPQKQPPNSGNITLPLWYTHYPTPTPTGYNYPTSQPTITPPSQPLVVTGVGGFLTLATTTTTSSIFPPNATTTITSSSSKQTPVQGATIALGIINGLLIFGFLLFFSSSSEADELPEIASYLAI
jgi:hypothetical protein